MTQVENLIENEITVEMIHNDFFSVNEKLLSLKPIEIDSKLIEKVEKLKLIGVSSDNVILRKYKELEWEQDKIEELISYKDFINLYNKKYPFIKVIEHSSVIKLCTKYNLCLNLMSNYLGDIPDKNIDEIFANKNKIANEDKFIREVDTDTWGDRKKSELKLLIVAPKDLFNTFILESEKHYVFVPETEKQFEVKIDDPIVLFPVRHDEQEYYYSFQRPKLYLILSAWGPEANDELVVNEKLN